MNQENRPGSVDELARLYRDTILRHATHPATHQCEKYNPLCGDRISILLEIDGSRIAATAFEGEACAICMASASLLCEELAEKGVDEIQRRLGWLMQELGQNADEKDSEVYDSLKPLLGVRRYPSRTRCALLPWEAASGALENETP
jgi:nitrogen fixation NifU-like protein